MNQPTQPEPIRQCQICQHHQTHWAWRSCKRVDCPVDYSTMTHIPSSPTPPPPPYVRHGYLTYTRRRDFVVNRGLTCPYCKPGNTNEVTLVDERPWQAEPNMMTQHMKCTTCSGEWHEVYRLTGVLTDGQFNALYPTEEDQPSTTEQQGVLAITPHERIPDSR